MLGIVTFFAFVTLAFGADSHVPAKEQSGCSPAQFMAWIYTMGTCVSLEFKDAIIEKHLTHGISNGIFQNISGSSELNKVCLRCHIRSKQKPY
jgi:hypothetical protein